MTFLKYFLKIYIHNSVMVSINIFRHYRVFQEWGKQIQLQKTPLELKLPWITIKAKNFIVAFFEDKTDLKIFEYGSGGSSAFFKKYATLLVSIEHNKEWYNKVKDSVFFPENDSYKIFLIEADKNSDKSCLLNKENPYHYYTEDAYFKDYNFKNYVKSIDGYQDNFFDIVAIDGRSRASCIMHATQKIKVGGLLVVDNSERNYYYTQTKGFLTNFNIELNEYSALICTPQFTQTNIYKKIK